MNPELIQYYQELVDDLLPKSPECWESLRVTATVDEIGLGLGIKFLGGNARDIEISTVPKNFRLVQKIRDASGPNLAWSEWIFDFNRDGKYNIQVKYPDTPAT